MKIQFLYDEPVSHNTYELHSVGTFKTWTATYVPIRITKRAVRTDSVLWAARIYIIKLKLNILTESLFLGRANSCQEHVGTRF